MVIEIDLGGYKLDVYYEELPVEEGVGLSGGIDIYKVEYGDCDVTDVINACDYMPVVEDLVNVELDKR